MNYDVCESVHGERPVLHLRVCLISLIEMTFFGLNIYNITNSPSIHSMVYEHERGLSPDPMRPYAAGHQKNPITGL